MIKIPVKFQKDQYKTKTWEELRSQGSHYKLGTKLKREKSEKTN